MDDAVLWDYAREHAFIVVSKDADFSELSMIHGFPPKLLWLRIGNCSTDDVEELIRSSDASIEGLAADDARGILVLFARNAT